MEVCVDTVKKYKKEWEYLINGGELAVKCFSELVYPQFKRWLITNKDELNSFTSNFGEVYLINDEYVEYRKAQTENKTIEYRVLWRNGEIAQDWTQTDIIQEMSIGAITEFRVKPEEPKFKVGDWVENSKSSLRIIKQVTAVAEGCDTVTVGDKKVGINVMLITDLKLWKPKPGEWCWFWNNSDKIKYSNLSQFVDMYNNKFRTEDTIYDNCAPFTEELPPHLKDN